MAWGDHHVRQPFFRFVKLPFGLPADDALKFFHDFRIGIGNIKLAHSISAGLDYPGVGPEHAYLRDAKRAEYVSVTDREAMDALLTL
mgnify:CR=1 FL=1